MRIKFIFNLAYKNIQFYELLSNLNEAGHEVIVYDLISSKKFTPSNNKTEYFNPFFGAKYILRIKYFRALFKYLINTLIITKEFNKNDTINLHYMTPLYSRYAHLIKKKGSRFLITFWGSDLLRANGEILTKYIPLLNVCDFICIPSKMQEDFINIFKGYNKNYDTYYNYDNKLKTLYFGLSMLDYIEKVDKKLISRFKDKYNLPKNNMIYIAIAHNGSRGQQHNIMIDILKRIDFNIKNRIFLLLPFTYGADANYKKEVLDNLEELGIPNHMFTEFMSMQELAVLRCVSDITLNIQITDGFSASISEALFAKNIVITGDWLPYAVYQDWGVNIYRERMNEIENRLVHVVKNLDNYLEDVNDNSIIIYDKLSWKTMLPNWEKVLDKNDKTANLNF